MARKSFIIFGVLVLAGVAAALGFFWPFGNGPDTLQLYGIVEIQEVRLGSKVSGRVAKVEVQEGDLVQSDQPLVWFEVPELEKQRDQWVAKLNAAQTERDRVEKSLPHELKAVQEAAELAQAEYARVQKGWREEEIEMARHEKEMTQADLKVALLDYARALQLLQQSATARADYDRALALKNQAQGRYDTARTKYEMLVKGSRTEDIAAARAKLEQAQANYHKLEATQYQIRQAAQAQVEEIQAKLAEIEVNLKEAVVRAADPAVVEVVSVRKGDLVAPNQPILRVLRAEDLWVKVFVPETELGKVRLHQTVEVWVDAYPDHPFQGTVVQVGSISEFTPRNVQSVEERRYQVFPVKIRVADPQGVFKAGMAAKVVVPLAPAP